MRYSLGINPIRCQVLLSLVVAVLLTGCFGGGHAQRSAALIDDKVTAARVRSVLDASPAHEFKRVQILSTNSVVTLSGVVASEAQKQKAGELAANVDRVQRLNNEIVVKAR